MNNQMDINDISKKISEQDRIISQMKTMISKMAADHQKIIRQLNSCQNENRQLRQEMAALQQMLRRL